LAQSGQPVAEYNVTLLISRFPSGRESGGSEC
jgi:hypothetical protein